MTRREKFRHYAEACLRLAEQIVAPEEKALLVSMAQGWYDMAEQAERVEQPSASQLPLQVGEEAPRGTP